MSTTFWRDINPEYSGEAWLSMHDPKKNTKAADEREAVQRGRVANKCIENGNLPIISVDGLIEDHGFEDFHQAVNGCGESVHIDYRRSRSGYAECDEVEGEISREELKERLLARCSPALFDMLEMCGNSWAKLVPGLKKSTSSMCGHRLQKEIQQLRKNGATQQEIIELVERRMGKYFPGVVEKYAVKKVEPTFKAEQKKKVAQLELFETADV